MMKSSIRRKGAAALAAAVTLVLADHAFAQTTPPVTWDGTTGAYITATNWDPDTTPSNAANQFLSINNPGPAQDRTPHPPARAVLARRPPPRAPGPPHVCHPPP